VKRFSDRADLDRLLALGPSFTSNSTFWFSLRVLKPLPGSRRNGEEVLAAAVRLDETEALGIS
jgi:hypothetical protein